MKKVMIYTRSTCPYCGDAKDLLQKKGVPYDEVVIDQDDEQLKKLTEKTGCDTVPQIFIDDNFIGGCSDLEKMESSGELDRLLS